MTPPKVLVVHPGTQHAPRLAEALYNKGLLYLFRTGWAVSNNEPGKRAVGIPSNKLRTSFWLEASAVLAQKIWNNKELVWFWRNKIFQRLVPDKDIQAADIIIGFDTASHILAQRACKQGKRIILEQSILDPEAKQEALRAMAMRYPKWACEAKPRPSSILSAERMEQRLAERISVPSKYVGDSLTRFGVPHEKIFINPYGTNTLPGREIRPQSRGPKKCRFLFAGSVTGRKGVPLLLEAWAKVASPFTELTIAGNMTGMPAVGPHLDNVRFLGQLSRKEMASAFQENDVFVFPSYAEGMPLVVLEAMAAGLPVIATPVAEGVVHSWVNGILIPFDAPVVLAEAMIWLAADYKKRSILGQAAKQTAAEFSWKAYGDRYATLLENMFVPFAGKKSA